MPSPAPREAFDALSPHTRARLVKVIGEERPADALRLISTRFASLPPGIELTPHSLHIGSGQREFLTRLGAVLFALENDTDRMLEFFEKGNRAG